MNESEEEDYYEQIRTNNAFNSNYIEYESSGDKYKILSIKEYLDMIRQYLSDVINNHKTRGEWKIQLPKEINYISPTDSNDTRTMHAKSYNIETMRGSETDEIIGELFESLLERYQEVLEEKMRGSEFFFDGVDLLY